MKKIFIMLLVTFLVQAQTVYDIGGAILVSDTLKTTDSVSYVPLNWNYDWGNITYIDTGSVFTDSVVVEYPTFNYTLKSGTTRRWKISDTTWSAVQFLKDSTWADKTVLGNNGGNASYRLFVGDYKEIRIRWINVEAVPSRAGWYKAQFTEKQ